MEIANAPQSMFAMTSKPGTEKLVAVCDVDWDYGPVLSTFEKFPGAKKYKDWRVMLDEMGKSIDAVVIATADHAHANPAATAMTLGYPTKVQGQSTQLKKDACPHAQIVKMIFPARPNLPHMAMPEVEVTWYDGGFHAMIPDVLPEGKTWEGEGCALYGTKDTLILGSHGTSPYLLSGKTPNAPEVLRVIPDNNHYLDWVAACKDPGLHDKTASHFGEAGPFNEIVLMGVLAVRLQKLGRILEWDGPNMKFTNISDTEKVSIWSEMFDLGKMMAAANAAARTAGGSQQRSAAPAAFPGMPGYEDPSAVNARDFIATLVKHQYLNGFKLPDMPA